MKIVKMCILTLLVGVLITADLLNAVGATPPENYEIEWNRNFGGSGDEVFQSVVARPGGGYTAVGYSESVDGDLMGQNRGDADAVIANYDSNGDLWWSGSFGGHADDIFSAVAAASDGGYAVVGVSYSNDGDLAGLHKGSRDAILAKYSATGVLQWNKNFGGSSDDVFSAVAATPDGGCVAVGYSYSKNGDLTGLNKGSIDAVIVKYSPNGTLEWNKNFGGIDVDYFWSVDSTPDGGYITSGYSSSNDGDLAGLNKGRNDAIVVKFDASGAIEWSRNFGGSGYEHLYSIISISDGGYVAVGNSNSVDGDLAGLNKGNDDAIVVKYSASGVLEWNRNFGGSDYDYFYSVASVSGGGYVMVGGSDSIDGDVTGLNRGGQDAIVAKYDASGALEWNDNFGGSDTDELFAVASTMRGGFVAAGYSDSTDGDLSELNLGRVDAIIVKYLDSSYREPDPDSDQDSTQTEEGGGFKIAPPNAGFYDTP